MAVDHECEEGGTCCWMENLAVRGIGNQSMIETLLPGSHDSATCNIDNSKPYASNAPPILLKAKRIYSGMKLKNLVCRWAVAQERSIFEQLCDGIRYIDLRVCSVKQPGDEIGTMYTCHSVISDNIVDVLNQLKSYVTTHPKEIIVIDFNHFYDMDKLTHRHLINMLQDMFASNMIPNNIDIHTHIGELWESGKSLFMFYESEQFSREFEFLWSQVHIKSAWMNTPDIQQLKIRLDKHLRHRKSVIDGETKDAKRDYRSIFHVAQGILTPDTSMIAKSVLGARLKGLKDVGKLATPEFVQWFSEEWKDLDLNILLADHYSETNFVDVIIHMNINKLLAKAEQ